jgi:hypothetical protein
MPRKKTQKTRENAAKNKGRCREVEQLQMLAGRVNWDTGGFVRLWSGFCQERDLLGATN